MMNTDSKLIQQRWRLGVHNDQRAFIVCRLCGTALLAMLIVEQGARIVNIDMHNANPSSSVASGTSDVEGEHGDVIVGRCTNCKKQVEIVLSDLCAMPEVLPWSGALALERDRLFSRYVMSFEDIFTQAQDGGVRNPNWRSSKHTLREIKNYIITTDEKHRRWHDACSDPWESRQIYLEEQLLTHLRARDFYETYRLHRFAALFHQAEINWLGLYLMIWEWMIAHHYEAAVLKKWSNEDIPPEKRYSRDYFAPEYPPELIRDGKVTSRSREGDGCILTLSDKGDELILTKTP